MPETPASTTAADPKRPEARGTKRVRIDRGSDRGSDLKPGLGSVLRAFGAWGRQPARAEEKRSDARHDVEECRAWVGWKTWRRFPIRHALMVNLSRGGALVFLDAPPPTDKPIWVYLETPGQKAVVKGKAVEIRETAAGQCTVRIAFETPCPYTVFEAAVCGLAPVDPRSRVAKPVSPTGGRVRTR